MSLVLAVAAALAWAIGAAVTPAAAWLWIRAGRRRLILAVFAGGLFAELAWLTPVARQGPAAVLAPALDVGMTGWAAWAVGVGGAAALVSGLWGRTRRGVHLAAPDRAVGLALGLFGLGILLQQLARIA